MVDGVEGDEIVNPPWFADREVDVLIFRINRRPAEEPGLFSHQPEPFREHLLAALPFQTPVTTAGRGTTREWLLGNQGESHDASSLVGVVGFHADSAREKDSYNPDTGNWEIGQDVVRVQQIAPFAISYRQRYLCVVKNPDFADGTVRTVFQMLLDLGEAAREAGGSTEWEVANLLDQDEFSEWLDDVDVVERITFTAKLPNPDGEDRFLNMDRVLEKHMAGEMTFGIKAADPEVGLNKDLTDEPITAGLMGMASRSFVTIAARARALDGSVRKYRSRKKVRTTTEHMPDTLEGATEAVAAAASRLTDEDFPDG